MSSPNAVFGSSPYALGGEPPTGGKLKPYLFQIAVLVILVIIILVVVMSGSSDTPESTVFGKSKLAVYMLAIAAGSLTTASIVLDCPTKTPLGDNTTA
jgi:hypothetical protein